MPHLACLAYSHDLTFNAIKATHDDHQPPPRKPKHRGQVEADKAKRRKKRRSRHSPDPRSVRCALEGMLLAYDRLGETMDGEPLERARAAFQGQRDFPAIARLILGWPDPVEIPKDPTVTPPWEG